MVRMPAVSSSSSREGSRRCAISGAEISKYFIVNPAREIRSVKLVMKNAPKLWLSSLCWASSAMLPFSRASGSAGLWE